jgi:hypothetical protein
VPRATASLGRPLHAVLVNRSTVSFASEDARPAWLQALRTRMPEAIVGALEGVQSELSMRLRFEGQLRRELAGTTRLGIFALDEQLALGVDGSPRAIVEALATSWSAVDVQGAA